MNTIKKLQKEDIVFYPQKGLGRILFTAHEEDVVSLLGEPAEKEEISDEENRVVLYYYNTDPRLDCIFHYEKEKLDYLSVFTQNIVLDGFELAAVSKDMMSDFIREYHSKHNLVYRCEVSRAEDVNEDYYQFDSIGLTIWYAGEFISEICVQKPVI